MPLWFCVAVVMLGCNTHTSGPCEEMLDFLENVLKERLGAETSQNLDSDAF